MSVMTSQSCLVESRHRIAISREQIAVTLDGRRFEGIVLDRGKTAGYADTQPVASNDTPEGRAQNRRIEIVLMPNLDELPDLSALEQQK